MTAEQKPIGITHIKKADEPRLFLNFELAMADGTVLDNNVFRLTSFQGQESVSGFYQFDLELHGNSEAKNHLTLSFDAMVGRPARIDVYGRWSAGAADRTSPFHGIVSGVVMQEPGVYRMTVRPALWKLSLTNRYCIHSNKSVRDLIAYLLAQHKIPCDLSGLDGKDNPAVARVQDWLQAGETDYALIERLLGKAHIYYYFVHDATGATVIFANRPKYEKVLGNGGALRYTYTEEAELGLHEDDVISQYSYQQNMVSSGVVGTFTRQEHAWEHDTVPVFYSYHARNPGSKTGELPFHFYRVYQYGCSDKEVKSYTDATSDTLATSATQFSGSSYCPHFHVGYQFFVAGPRGPHGNAPWVRPTLDGRWFVLTQVKHTASLDGSYQNQFEATEANGLITPFSIQETHQGMVLAKVVAGDQGTPPGDWRYYTKQNFDAEHNSFSDKDVDPATFHAKGVYVRFSTDKEQGNKVWVKLAPHMQTVPEIGVTVLVARASDESELPEIQSIVQANGSSVVTPSRWTANTHVGSSYSTSYGDSKSIRYGRTSQPDLEKAIGIINKEYDSGRFRDASFSQGAGYSYSTSENGRNGILSKSESYGSNYSHYEGAETRSYSDVDHSYNESHGKTSENYSTINGSTFNQQTVNGSSESHSVNNGSVLNTSAVNGVETNISSRMMVNSSSVTVSANSMNTTILNTSLNTTAMSNSFNCMGMQNDIGMTGMSNSMSMVGESNGLHVVGATSQISVTGESSSVGVTGSEDGVSVTGTSDRVSVVGSTANIGVTGSSTGVNVTGSSTSVGVVGENTGVNVVGSSTDVGVTGESTRINVTGSATGVNVTGESTDINITGESTTVRMTGDSTTIDMTGESLAISMSGNQTSVSITGQDVQITEIKIVL